MVSWPFHTEFTAIGELSNWAGEADGKRIVLKGQAGSLAISSPAPQVMRVRSGRGGDFGEDRSFAVLADRSPQIPAVVSEDPEKLELDFSGLRVLCSRKTMSLAVYDSDRVLLFRDHPRFGVTFRREGLGLAHLIEPGARYFGFGEKTGPLDKRGRAMTMWATDMPYHTGRDPMYVSIPWTLIFREGRAFGLFFDNPCRSRFNVGKSHPQLFTYQVDGGELDLYVIAGPRVKDVIARFTALTGRTPMPPRWSLGHQQCRWSYMNEAQVRKIAKNFRDRDLPTDVIYLDIHYLDRYRVFTFDRDRFPDVKTMTADLAKDGFSVVAAVDPGVAVAPDYPLYTEGRDQGYFCRRERGGEYHSRVWPGKVAFPDFAKPEVRVWWGDAHRALTDQGIRGVWNDMNEPSCWAADLRIKEAVIPLIPVRKPKMVHDDEGRATPHRCFRNLYGLLECEAAYAGLQKLRPGERPFILSRSGYAGIQRSAAVWTGDNFSTFAHLALTIPMLLNLSLSGVPFVGPDIGGFALNCSPELYARWIELGAFYPLCRTHSALRTRRQEPWTFGRRVESIARKYLKLRYRLHPTLYSYFRQAHETGEPILRPLFYEFPDDPTAARITDQLLFGRDLLIAPVMKKRQTRREVYLPPAIWTDFWTGQKIQGPVTVTREAPLEVLPLYVRDGAGLFMWPALRWLEERPVDRLFVELYPPESGAASATLYEDDGITADYLAGAFAKRDFIQEREENRLRIRLEKKQGPFTPPPRQLLIKIHLGKRPRKVELDQKEMKMAEEPSAASPETSVCAYLQGEHALGLALADDHEQHEIKLEL